MREVAEQQQAPAHEPRRDPLERAPAGGVGNAALSEALLAGGAGAVAALAGELGAEGLQGAVGNAGLQEITGVEERGGDADRYQAILDAWAAEPPLWEGDEGAASDRGAAPSSSAPSGAGDDAAQIEATVRAGGGA